MPQKKYRVLQKTVLAGLIFFASFAASTDAGAEAVYLRNGRVMVGRIVEKNPDYLVLQTGEGDDAVTATIFHDDIARIEDEETYAQELRDVPFYLKNSIKPSGMAGPSSLPLRPPTESITSRIFALVEGDKQIKADTPSYEEELAQLPKFDGSPLTVQAYASYMQMLEERRKAMDALAASLKNGRVAPQGNGRIKGIITLPKMPAQMPVEEEASGGLYVYLLSEQPDGRYAFPAPMVYDIIDAEDLTVMQTRYEIIGIPPGRYKVFAQWDVGAPAVREERSGGDAFLNYLGADGDLSGFQKDVVTLGRDDEVEGIDFFCADTSSFDQIFFSWLQPYMYSITDIYYTRPTPDDPHILLVFKNLGAGDIDMLALDLFIDNMKMIFPLELTDIAPGEEKEFDISSFFLTHLKMTEGAKLVRKARSILFRVQNPITKKVEFEKTLYIY